MNPNMFGQMPMGQMPSVPTTKELWKDEKTKYRHWIILFGVAMLAIMGLLITGLIMNITNESSIKTDLNSWGKHHLDWPNDVDTDLKRKEFTSDWANHYWKWSLIVTQSVKLALVVVGVILYISTVSTAYKKQSFAHISKWATMIVGLGALIGVWQLMSLLIGSSPIFTYPQGIFDFILYILPILVFLFVSAPINKMRRLFAYSERVEAFKNSPQYQQMQDQMAAMQNGNAAPNSMGPYGPVAPAVPVNPANVKPTAKKAPTKSEKRQTELKAMSKTDLEQIAKKLSISGYKDMKKDELIKNIIRISESN